MPVTNVPAVLHVSSQGSSRGLAGSPGCTRRHHPVVAASRESRARKGLANLFRNEPMFVPPAGARSGIRTADRSYVRGEQTYGGQAIRAGIDDTYGASYANV